jgi:hypothetical protein
MKRYLFRTLAIVALPPIIVSGVLLVCVAFAVGRIF